MVSKEGLSAALMASAYDFLIGGGSWLPPEPLELMEGSLVLFSTLGITKGPSLLAFGFCVSVSVSFCVSLCWQGEWWCWR